MAKASIRYAKDKRHPGGFVPLPHAVIRHERFAHLSSKAVKLLLDLLAQYRGDNNGDLCATWSMMAERGWRSRDTLSKALNELVEWGWIVQTRQGGMNSPNLYGVTFFALDPSPKLEVSAKAFPRGAWYQATPIDTGQKRDLEHAGRVDLERFNTEGVSSATPASYSQPGDRVVEAGIV